MPPQPRSFLIGAWLSTANSSHTFLLVPAGMTVIIKSITMRNTGGTAGDSYITITDPDAGVQAIAFRHQWLTTESDLYVERWIVVEANMYISGFAEQASVGFWLSGTLLQGVAQLPALGAGQFIPDQAGPPAPPTGATIPLPNLGGA